MELVHNKITKIEEAISRVLEYIVSIAFFIILSLTIILVVLRYVFTTTILGGNELMEFLFIYTTSLGAAVSIGKREHIKIDFFLNKLRQPYRMIVDSFGQISIAAINVVIAWLSYGWMKSAGWSTESSVMRIPMWIVYIIIPVGAVLVAMFSLMNILKIVREGIAEMKDVEIC